MFYKHSNEGKVAILIAYVDDIVLIGDDCNELEKLKGKLVEEFEIKDMGALKYFLGMKFSRSKEGIFVNQRKYVLDETTFLVSMVSQFMHGPGLEHFEVVYRILRYLKGHQVVTWLRGEAKKQNMVVRSSAEDEFRVVAHGICDIMWIRRLPEELKMTGSSPMKLYCDNKATISIAHNPVLHDRTKHVEVDKHFIKEKIDNRLVCMTYIPTEEQVADVFTKGLHKRQFDFLVGKLAMEDIFKPA
ncbi:Retrovirus-related Pol polyprotein from transposon RE1 [Vitis vinifera]|uniref:Retrovirus-related Pol polyprotein from transposon RE1 n=1 Tax=Vitis vinifera TaxID=29760 RepID=A0A438EHN2_VITVI|nr:Retrovirus-related Pol polyprotein from transposon RE1 [Vitis vinifera]